MRDHENSKDHLLAIKMEVFCVVAAEDKTEPVSGLYFQSYFHFHLGV